MIPNSNRLADAHKKAPTIPEDMDQGAIVIRYDGHREKDPETKLQTPVVFAVITIDDLAKVSPDVMKGIPLLHQTDAGTLAGSPHAFFRQGSNGTAFYCDTDRHPCFVDVVSSSARSRGIAMYSLISDINLMAGVGMDIDPPEKPAYVVNGFSGVSARAALADLSARREAYEAQALDAAREDPDADPLHP